ncbi:MAG: hypothetical protein KME13_09070 [Myxacorys californica WJT36-NPBG1]|jgi:hypothetical protein|nr:hypothetical protein [Myxacorys californica WJT36-NPBG1]
MSEIHVRLSTDSDGVLHLDIPTLMKDEQVEVTVIFQPVVKRPEKPPEELGWSPEFLALAGCLADDPMTRPPQGEFEERDWDAFNDIPD